MRSIIQVTSWIKRVPVHSLWYDRRQERLVNLSRIGVPKGKTANLQQLEITSLDLEDLTNKTQKVRQFESRYGFSWHFLFLNFFFHLLIVRKRHCPKQARRSCVELNKNVL